MKRKVYVSAATLFTLAIMLNSCAGVKLFTTADGNKTTRLKFYYAQPYLLVEYNPEKEVAQKSSIIYLPDLQNPVYAEQKRGFGSSELQIAYENGSISSYGLTTDSKVPETIASIAGLIPALASNGKVETSAAGKAKTFALYKIHVVDSSIVLTEVIIK